MISVLDLISGDLALLLFHGSDEVPGRWLEAVSDGDHPRLSKSDFAIGDSVLIRYSRTYVLLGQPAFGSGRFTERAKHGRATTCGHSTLARRWRGGRQQDDHGYNCSSEAKYVKFHCILLKDKKSVVREA